MLIDALIDFYEQNPNRVLPAYHTERETDYLLEIDKEGTFRGITSAEIPVISPDSSRTTKPPAHLVFDKASFVFAIYPDEEKAEGRHDRYCKRVTNATDDIKDPRLVALRDFLDNEEEVEEAKKVSKDEGATKDDWIAPVVDDELLVAKRDETRPTTLARTLQEKWIREMSEEYLAEDGECLGCGESRRILRLHGKVSGFGTPPKSFVNMNKEAFRSHGLEQSANAPMCLDCATKYVQALEYLSNCERHHLVTRVVRDDNGQLQEQTKWIAWVRIDTPDFDFSFISKPDPEDALDTLRSIYRSSSRDVKANQFHAASLTMSDNRISLRRFQRSELKKVIKKTKKYFDRQALIRYGDRQTYSLFSLLEAAAPLTKNQSTGRQEPDRERLPPRFADALVEHVLTGHALPKSLRDRALRRCRAEQSTAPTSQDDRRRVDYAVPVHRAALLKLFLSSQSDSSMAAQEKLNREHSNPAYHCGRYLAVADSVYYATSDAENYVSSRYYSSASTTPASVIGRIIPNVQHQLDKLRREQAGRATNLDKEITQIMNQIGDEFPKTLQPNEQALFALGFYQQRDHEMTSPADDE